MYNIDHIENELNIANNVASLSLAYEEISVMKMQRIRDEVLNHRKYVERLYQVFKEVSLQYYIVHNKNIKVLDGETVATYSTLTKNGKTLFVLLTPNAKLSGNLTNLVVLDFVDKFNAKKQKLDCIVIGKLGKMLLNKHIKTDPKYFKFYELPSSKNTRLISEITEVLMQYSRVVVFYGKFKNLLNRVSDITDISGLPNKEEIEEGRKTYYIFEPDVKNILNFFETQIFSVLFKQKVLESKLGSLGSRISAMESAVGNAQKRIDELLKMESTYLKYSKDKKQRQTMSSISLWG